LWEDQAGGDFCIWSLNLRLERKRSIVSEKKRQKIHVHEVFEEKMAKIFTGDRCALSSPGIQLLVTKRDKMQ
jgi:hypothetical protein